MAPLVALVWSVVCIAATVILKDVRALVEFLLLFTLLWGLKAGTLNGLLLAAKFTFPFALPLALVHGVLNPKFPTTAHVYDLLPLRLEGFWFSLVVTLRLFTLALIMVLWRDVDPNRLWREAIRAKLPPSLLVIVAVAAAHLQLLASRIQIIYLAQRARGVPAGPSLLARIRILPRIVIPLMASTLNEGNARGLLMTNRGLGTTRITTTFSEQIGVKQDLGWSLAGIGALATAWLIH